MSETRTSTADLHGAFSQAGRSIAIDTPLGPDALLLTSVQGEDRISQPFVYTVEFLTMAGDSAVRGLIGKRVTLWLQNNHESWRRPVNGYVRRITGQPTSLRGYGGYRAEVVPRLWFLDCTADCRVFQTMTYPAIVKTLLDENGVTGCDFKLLKTDYPTVDYCVQYRESALAFISRLMEHVGIFFFHEHSAADHKLVITDANSFTKFTTPRQLRTGAAAERGEIERVWSDTVFRPGAWTLTDYDFETPSKPLQKQVKTMLAVNMMPQHERYDYPGGYTEQDVGGWMARLRIEAEEAHHDSLGGLAHVAAMGPGFRFELAHTQNAQDEPASYLLTEVRHQAQERSYFQEADTEGEYSCDFTAIPAATPYRPMRTTRRPLEQGQQTAVVTGPPGEIIHTDKYGRVKVQFHWDRLGKRDGNTSCWVRVSQPWAGSGWGGVFTPHVGHEVIVTFLEGDPDKPVITGRVFNGDNSPTVGLPANKTQSAIQDHGGNRVVMEGKKGSEDIRTIATKDQNTTVGHNLNLTVTTNRTTKVGVDDAQTVSANQTITIGGKQNVSITGTSSLHASGDRDVVLGASHKHSVNASEQWVVNGERKLTVNGHYGEVLGAGLSVTVTGDTKVKGSGEITIDAGQKMSLIVGGSSIVLTPSGITITASGDVTVLGATIKHNT